MHGQQFLRVAGFLQEIQQLLFRGLQIPQTGRQVHVFLRDVLAGQGLPQHLQSHGPQSPQDVLELVRRHPNGDGRLGGASTVGQDMFLHRGRDHVPADLFGQLPHLVDGRFRVFHAQFHRGGVDNHAGEFGQRFAGQGLHFRGWHVRHSRFRRHAQLDLGLLHPQDRGTLGTPHDDEDPQAQHPPPGQPSFLAHPSPPLEHPPGRVKPAFIVADPLPTQGPTTEPPNQTPDGSGPVAAAARIGHPSGPVGQRNEVRSRFRFPWMWRMEKPKAWECRTFPRGLTHLARGSP